MKVKREINVYTSPARGTRCNSPLPPAKRISTATKKRQLPVMSPIKKRKGVPFSQTKPIEAKELFSQVRKIQVINSAAKVPDIQLPRPGKWMSLGKKLETNPPIR